MKIENLLCLFLALSLSVISCDKGQIPDTEDHSNKVYFTATIFDGKHMASVSKNVDSYLVSFSNEDATISYGLVLSNVLGEIDDQGYVTVPSGTYTLGDGATAFTIADYSEYIVSSSDGTDYDSFQFDEATFVVAETESILTAVIEGVTHIMTYNGSLRMLADLPAPPVEFEASYAYAYYAPGIFKLYLSDLGLDADGNEQANGTYYEFNINVGNLDPEAEIAIPAGTYKINGEYYKFDENADDVVESDIIVVGSITIDANGTVEAECTMMFSGSTHNVTYSGEIQILESTIPTEPPYSTLTADKVCDFSNHDLMCLDRGDYYNSGHQTWTVSISGNDGTGDHMAFEILGGKAGKSDFYGKYIVSGDMGEYTALPGYVEGFTLMSSWYYFKQNSENVTEYAPVVSGWVEISKQDGGAITVEFDVYDDQNNNITGKYTQKN